eukprot:scaffold2048_cov204-Alexandrium_tamarense.AAC.46
MDNDDAMIVCKQSIHFFCSDGNGHWKEVTTLNMPNVFCTMSVALSGKTAVVGVPIDYSGEGRDRVRTGVVFISGSNNDESMFGNSVAISRNQMMIVSSSNVFAYSLLED